MGQNLKISSSSMSEKMGLVEKTARNLLIRENPPCVCLTVNLCTGSSSSSEGRCTGSGTGGELIGAGSGLGLAGGSHGLGAGTARLGRPRFDGRTRLQNTTLTCIYIVQFSYT